MRSRNNGPSRAHSGALYISRQPPFQRLGAGSRCEDVFYSKAVVKRSRGERDAVPDIMMEMASQIFFSSSPLPKISSVPAFPVSAPDFFPSPEFSLAKRSGNLYFCGLYATTITMFASVIIASVSVTFTGHKSLCFWRLPCSNIDEQVF